MDLDQVTYTSRCKHENIVKKQHFFSVTAGLALERWCWQSVLDVGSHKRTAWGCRGCGRIPNTEKLANIWAKIFNIWAKYTATFTCKWGSVYFPN